MVLNLARLALCRFQVLPTNSCKTCSGLNRSIRHSSFRQRVLIIRSNRRWRGTVPGIFAVAISQKVRFRIRTVRLILLVLTAQIFTRQQHPMCDQRWLDDQAEYGQQCGLWGRGNGRISLLTPKPPSLAEQGNRIINTTDQCRIPNVNTDVRNNPPPVHGQSELGQGRHTLTIGGTWLHSFTLTRSALLVCRQPRRGSRRPINNVLRPAQRQYRQRYRQCAYLYSLLTGRVTNISVATQVDEGTQVHDSRRRWRYAFTTVGLYAQDSFRISPDLTLNFGLRWQFDGDIHSGNDLLSQPSGDNFYGPSTALFQPGVLNGNPNPAFVLAVNPYGHDYVNPAPNFGFAWNPSGGRGFFGKLIGDRKTVVRGGYSISFYNEGLNSISNSLSGGRGLTQSGTATNGIDFGPGSLELRSPTQPFVKVFPATFGFPIFQNAFSAPVAGNYINPDLVSPYVQNWSLGVQRQLTNAITLEVRYVGNKATHMWHRQNLNEINIFENGFLNEFTGQEEPRCQHRQWERTNLHQQRSRPQASLPVFGTFAARRTTSAFECAGLCNATFIRI